MLHKRKESEITNCTTINDDTLSHSSSHFKNEFNNNFIIEDKDYSIKEQQCDLSEQEEEEIEDVN